MTETLIKKHYYWFICIKSDTGDIEHTGHRTETKKILTDLNTFESASVFHFESLKQLWSTI